MAVACSSTFLHSLKRIPATLPHRHLPIIFARKFAPRAPPALHPQHRESLEKLLQSSPPPSPAHQSNFNDSHDATPSTFLHSWWQKLDFLPSPRLRGIFLLNVLTFLYGSNIPVIKEVEATTDPWLFLCGRFTLATIVFLPYVLQGMKDKEVRNAGIELGLWISMGYLTQGVSLLTTDAGRASFFSAFTVIVVPLLAGFSGTKVSRLTWASSGTALLGVFLLESSGSPATIGDLWSLLSAVLFGIHMLRTEHYSRAVHPQKCLPLIGAQLFVIAMSSLLYPLWSITISKESFLNLQGVDSRALWQSFIGMPWLPMMYTGVVSTAFCLWIEMSAMRDISATETAVIYSLEPLWGAAFAWCLLGERWGPKGWLGALLILGGSMAVQLFRAQKETSHTLRD